MKNILTWNEEDRANFEFVLGLIIEHAKMRLMLESGDSHEQSQVICLAFAYPHLSQVFVTFVIED
jgi:hypothetical protein